MRAHHEAESLQSTSHQYGSHGRTYRTCLCRTVLHACALALADCVQIQCERVLWGGLSFPEVRSLDPTSKAALQHYAKHQRTDSVEGLAELLLNICFVRNTMSKDLIQLVETGRAPWLCLDPSGAVAEASKRAADETFLRLDGNMFFPFVEPMKSRSKAPRRFFVHHKQNTHECLGDRIPGMRKSGI